MWLSLRLWIFDVSQIAWVHYLGLPKQLWVFMKERRGTRKDQGFEVAEWWC